MRRAPAAAAGLARLAGAPDAAACCQIRRRRRPAQTKDPVRSRTTLALRVACVALSPKYTVPLHTQVLYGLTVEPHHRSALRATSTEKTLLHNKWYIP